ncbi:MAG: KpsF/GutQ family sugar-phosphate isomerase [Planctomycetota bacterium]|jgi:arabinose-5-phosphate isomerase
MALDDDTLIARGREILQIEADALTGVRDRLNGGDGGFTGAVRALLQCSGKVVVTGVGKSGHVGAKLAATMASTGTPAMFLHPVEGLHGDLGMVQAGDAVLALSNSGETEEVINVVAAAKQRGLTVVALVGKPASTLGRAADHVLDAGVDKEACPLGLAPTASTTAALALGDALAMVVQEARGFTADDFARFHPGGSLGQRLTQRVKDLMRTGERVPTITRERTLRDAVDEMTVNESIGVVLIVDGDGALCGVCTDGDLRRVLHSVGDVNHALDEPIHKYSGGTPRTVEAAAPASEALQMMEAAGITSLAVVDTHSRPVGLLHLHDVLGRGKITLG